MKPVDGDLTIVEADLADPAHARDVVAMTAAYAEDAMGNGGSLPAEVLERLVPALREHPTTVVLLAYLSGRAVGIATCFLGFTTFAARPLLNIHDLAVLPEHRRRGVGRALLAGAERSARRRGCVKLTLEVQERNVRARKVYEAAGFSQAHYEAPAGGALFYTRTLVDWSDGAGGAL
jgi:ribosomal protein S18 acetylase RimI-like enzyme